MPTTRPTATVAMTFATTPSTSSTTRRRTASKAKRRSGRRPLKRCAASIWTWSGSKWGRVEVDGRRASWSRSGQELTVTPKRPLNEGRRFRMEIGYAGVPTEFILPGTDLRTGFMATPDGANVVGQPEVAAAWYPVNDHPIDKASYSFDVTVPDGYEV